MFFFEDTTAATTTPDLTDRVGIYVARKEAFIQLELVAADKIHTVLFQLKKLAALADCPLCLAKFSFRESYDFHMKRYHKR